MTAAARTVAIILECAGMGDCLYAVPILRKIRRQFPDIGELVLFTHQPTLFARCPYVNRIHAMDDEAARARYPQATRMFDTSRLPYHLMDTIDFMSIPAGLGQLSFRERQLEYFPAEPDEAAQFDVVLNTSMTWPSRSWPLASWQRLADELVAEGRSVAVVGKTVYSPWEQLTKTSEGLEGCVDLTNCLSLDQTYYTIAKAGLFVTCQNGLSVLCGATETEVIVLDRSIEWSKYAMYRHEDPHFRFSIVKGNCDIYCCDGERCPVFGEFRCIPGYDAVRRRVREVLAP